MSYLALETEAGASASKPRRPMLRSAMIGIAMTELTLFFAPDTCARVSMIALEETGHPYETELIAFKRGDHRSPRYLAINPKGRVPTFLVNGRVVHGADDPAGTAGEPSDTSWCDREWQRTIQGPSRSVTE